MSYDDMPGFSIYFAFGINITSTEAIEFPQTAVLTISGLWPRFYRVLVREKNTRNC